MASRNIPLLRTTSGLSRLEVPFSDRRQSAVPCPLCRRPDCKLKSHKAYLADGRAQGFRKHDVSALLSTTFAISYIFNPLSVACNRMRDQLQLDPELNHISTYRHLTRSLQKLIAYDIGINTPFTDPAGHILSEVAAEWLIASVTDDTACASVLNLWLIIEFTNTKRQDLGRFSSKVTTLFLSLLRMSIENERSISAGTVFAASTHLTTCLVFFDQTTEQREVMMDGLEALVEACGGFEKLTENSCPGLLQSLLWSDMIFSCLVGARPRFRVAAPLTMPNSLIPERNEILAIPHLYFNCGGPDLMDTAGYLRFFLLFRHQSEKRPLSKVEYRYMVALERFIHVQLLEQSARYHETGTMAECIVLAMGLVRMSVLCVWEQHVMARRSYTQRLGRALQIVSDNDWFEVGSASALIWVCWIILAQDEVDYSRNSTVRSMIGALKQLLGDKPSLWPNRWEEGFAHQFQPLLWHADYQRYVITVSKIIKDQIAV